jgi:decaprenylphospho-beta-D-ribofuranose 2-oxidase
MSDGLDAGGAAVSGRVHDPGASMRERIEIGGVPARRGTFVSFDRSTTIETLEQRPDRYRQLAADLGDRPRIARGGGRSYAAASFGADVLVQDLRAFDRLLAFDDGRVRVECGVTVGDLAAWAAARNLQVPVLPGHPAITVGGCIAADVHGKNPARDGTFCDWVESLTLFHPARGFHAITPAQADAFEATCGGFGLTGIVVDATLRLAPRPAGHAAVDCVAVSDLASGIARLHDTDADFAYTWHDGTQRGPAFGRGLLFSGRWTDAGPPDTRPMSALRASSPAERAPLPFTLWNPATVKAANALFRALSLRAPSRVQRADDAAFPLARNTAYHRFYGRRGLREVQLLVPEPALARFVPALAALVERCQPLLVMLSAKTFAARQRGLAMAGRGTLVALDLVPGPRTAAFLDALDGLVLESGLQPSVAKDSRLPAQVAARALPGHAAFRDRLARLDPQRLYRSALSRRLEL